MFQTKKVLYLPIERKAFVYITIIYNNISMYLDQKEKEAREKLKKARKKRGGN